MHKQQAQHRAHCVGLLISVIFAVRIRERWSSSLDLISGHSEGCPIVRSVQGGQAARLAILTCSLGASFSAIFQPSLFHSVPKTGFAVFCGTQHQGFRFFWSPHCHVIGLRAKSWTVSHWTTVGLRAYRIRPKFMIWCSESSNSSFSSQLLCCMIADSRGTRSSYSSARGEVRRGPAWARSRSRAAETPWFPTHAPSTSSSSPRAYHHSVINQRSF